MGELVIFPTPKLNITAIHILVEYENVRGSITEVITGANNEAVVMIRARNIEAGAKLLQEYTAGTAENVSRSVGALYSRKTRY